VLWRAVPWRKTAHTKLPKACAQPQQHSSNRPWLREAAASRCQPPGRAAALHMHMASVSTARGIAIAATAAYADFTQKPKDCFEVSGNARPGTLAVMPTHIVALWNGWEQVATCSALGSDHPPNPWCWVRYKYEHPPSTHTPELPRARRISLTPSAGFVGECTRHKRPTGTRLLYMRSELPQAKSPEAKTCGPQSRSQHWQHTRPAVRTGTRGCAEAHMVSGVGGHQTPTHTQPLWIGYRCPPVGAFAAARHAGERAEQNPQNPHDRQTGRAPFWTSGHVVVENACLDTQHTNLGGCKHF
jgi:hypothetical protein